MGRFNPLCETGHASFLKKDWGCFPQHLNHFWLHFTFFGGYVYHMYPKLTGSAYRVFVTLPYYPVRCGGVPNPDWKRANALNCND